MLTMFPSPGQSQRQQNRPLLPTYTLNQRPSTTRRLVFVEETTWSDGPPEVIPLVDMQATLPPVEEVD